MQHATKYSVYLGGKIIFGCRTKGCFKFSSRCAFDKIRFVALLSNILGNIVWDDTLLSETNLKTGEKAINHITR